MGFCSKYVWEETTYLVTVKCNCWSITVPGKIQTYTVAKSANNQLLFSNAKMHVYIYTLLVDQDLNIAQLEQRREKCSPTLSDHLHYEN